MLFEHALMTIIAILTRCPLGHLWIGKTVVLHMNCSMFELDLEHLWMTTSTSLGEHPPTDFWIAEAVVLHMNCSSIEIDNRQ
jgi:hypothetical protein